MASPLVSVVIPFLDPPLDFFREAIASVTSQDYRPAELILVDDGSGPPAAAFARRVPDGADIPVRCVEHDGGRNRGSSASRNLGVSVASGDYVAFLDADDAWSPRKLGEQVALLRDEPETAMVFGQTRYWYSWQGSARGAEDFVVRRGVEREVRFDPPDFVAGFLRGRVIVPSASNTMIRRDAYLACGGFEERFTGMYEDQAFLVKLGLRYRVAGTPRCWDSYRQHPGSMTAQANALGTERTARRRFLEWAYDYCREQDIEAPQVWEALNKERWLVDAESTVGPARRRRFAARLRRLRLRLEETLLPARVRERRWGRDSVRSPQSRRE